ncbi:MAG: hypothetical protein GH151_06985 [Bacteroidetes bacterium]|nr:hypothetical protein [Bacteroidota bacterium]
MAEEKSKVTPETPGFIYLDEMCGRLEDLEGRLIDAQNILDRGNLLTEYQLALKIAPRIRIYEYETVPAAESKQLFERVMTWGKGLMFVITHVANSTGAGAEVGGWYANTRAIWERDTDATVSMRAIEETIEYQYSRIENPQELTPWIPIFYNHKWTVYNNNAAQDIVAEVLMQGFIFSKYLFEEITERFFKKNIEQFFEEEKEQL